MRGDWKYSGDRFVEYDGFYNFLDRANNLVKVSGQWVWPLEVELCLSEHPQVHEFAVLAHKLAGRRLTLRAVVRPRGDFHLHKSTTILLQDYVRDELVPLEYPPIIDYTDELAKTGTDKIDRQALSRTTPQQPRNSSKGK